MLPDRLTLPLNFARAARFVGDLSARDQSYALAVGWLAAQRNPRDDDQPILVANNGLRHALGRSRRDNIDVEEQRLERLDAGEIETPHGRIGLPNLRYRGGLPVDGDTQQTWHLDSRLPFSMRVGIFTEEVVELPTSLLQHARHKETLTVMLRLLAWIEGHHDKKWLVEREDRFRVFRIAPEDLVLELGLMGRTFPSHLIERILEPAASEISEHTGYEMGVHAIRTAYRSRNGRTGKVKFVEIRVAIPELEKIRQIPARQKGKTWQTKPIPRKSDRARKSHPCRFPRDEHVIACEPVKSDVNAGSGVRKKSELLYYPAKNEVIRFGGTMAVGISEVEFGLARAYNRNLDTLQRTAQSIINRHDATINALRARVRELEAELEVERKARKIAEFRAGRARVAH